MMNVAIKEGPVFVDVKRNGAINYPSLSTYCKQGGDGGSIQRGIPGLRICSSKEVYHTVVVPTVFPPSNQSLPHVQISDHHNALYHDDGMQYCNSGLVVNNHHPSYHHYTAPVTSGLQVQPPSILTSFMQHQLHQHRKQHIRQHVTVQSMDVQFVPYSGSQRSPMIQHRSGKSQATVNSTAACSQQVVASPSPKRSSSRRHHHSHHHYYGHTSGAYDLLESEALQRRHKFPTNFCRILRECPPPVPPVLLRQMPASNTSNGSTASAVPRYKDPANRLKVTLRLLPSSVAASSPEGSFLSVDGRKKQATLMEQAQQSQRQATTASNGASAAMVPKVFNFDAAFSPDDSQTEICSTTLTEIVQTVVNEGDACVLVFGSAEQDKLQASIGSDSGTQSLGILPCAISWLYRLIGEVRQRNGARFSIRVSAVEVAGPQEELRDLLEDLAGISCHDASSGYEACLREDPVFGTQLHNVNELRAPTPDKAAFYLDAALAKRKASTEEERRNSHFFFTLHIYQYHVNEKQHQKTDAASVAGGRTRLHLIDLGAGEKSSKSGRASLTLPALGNVLLTLLQGQKHLPFKESKVTQILKSFIGSAVCKAVSVVACASSDPERRMESVNVVQIAGRLYRIRRTKRGSAKFGLGAGNSSGGESSTDERAGRRRFPRSASDPDCTTSSSEQSCDTVIYLGAGGARPKTGGSVTGSSSVAISDQDIATTKEEVKKPLQTEFAKTGVPGSTKKCDRFSHIRGPGKQMAVIQPSAVSAGIEEQAGWKYQNPFQGVFQNPLQGTLQNPLQNPLQRPLQYPLQLTPKSPKSPKPHIQKSTATASRDAPRDVPSDASISRLKSASAMDPFKREMIRQWVVTQEQVRSTPNGESGKGEGGGRAEGGRGEIWIDRCPVESTDQLTFLNCNPNYHSASPQQKAHSRDPEEPVIGRPVRVNQSSKDTEDQPGSVHSMSMETSSASSCDGIISESRDIGLQCCEEEIDLDCGRYRIPFPLYNDNETSFVEGGYNNNTVNQEYAAAAANLWNEPDRRMLEDIAEVEEEDITASSVSDGTRMTSSRHSSSLRGNILVAAASGSPPYRNEGMAPRALAGDRDIPLLLAAPSSSLRSLNHGIVDQNDEDDEHPLRILSRERVVHGSRSDTFSLDNDRDMDAYSVKDASDLFFLLGGAGELTVQNLSAEEDSSSLTDEDLERAMQASMTSIRSHEILEKLKSEGKLRRRNEEDEEQGKSEEDDEEERWRTVNVQRPQPDGLDGGDEKEEKTEKGSKSDNHVSSCSTCHPILDSLTKPTIPQLSKPVANLVTSRLISGLNDQYDDQKPRSNRSAVHKHDGKHTAAATAPITVSAGEESGAQMTSQSSSPRSSLPRPTKLASPRSQEKSTTTKSEEKASSSKCQEKVPSSKTPFSKAQGKDPSSKSQERISSSKSREKITSSVSQEACKPQQSMKQQKVIGKAPAKCEKEKPTKTLSNVGKLTETKPVKGTVKQTVPAASSIPSPGDKPKTKTPSSGFVLKSPIMSFLRSPSKFKKSPPTVPPDPVHPSCDQLSTLTGGVPPSPATMSVSSGKRASSGYDSGHDSGIVTVDSPDLLLASPYSKITKPRSSQRSSSGHGSDNSSAVSSDAGGNAAMNNAGKFGKTGICKFPPATKKSEMTVKGGKTVSKQTISSKEPRDLANSKYEGRERNRDETMVTSPGSGEHTDQIQLKNTTPKDSLKSPPSVKLNRRRWFEGFGFDASKSRSAPQSPNSSVTSPLSRLHRSVEPRGEIISDQRSAKEINSVQDRMQTVEKLTRRQNELKGELKLAKDRLGVPRNKWSYDLHVSECMDTGNPNMLEALEQETKILEKRVAACKSHVLMVTVFDAVPNLSTSPEAARKCS